MPPSRLLFALVAGAGFVLAWFVYLPGYLLRLSATWAWPQGHHPLLMLAGGALIAVGVGVVAVCPVAFARDGRGTLVPFIPPKRLVETGLYGWSRNPKYVAYVAVLVCIAMPIARIASSP